MKRKCLVVGIILLFVGIAYAPAIAQNTEKQVSTSRGNWLYVGGSGPGNYTRIQDAIDNASDGDTIFVYHGTYYEGNLNVSYLNLIGEERNTTIIEGGFPQSCIFCTDGDSNIHGFTLKKGRRVCIEIWGDNIIISHNIITNSPWGIQDYASPSLHHQVEIYNNIFINNTYYGIVSYGTGSSIHDNFFLSNRVGISIGVGGKTSVVHNHFEDNTIGIEIDRFRGIIRQNNFINNDNHATIDNQYNFYILPMIFFYHAFWINNYWDDWERLIPRPIQGTFGYYKIVEPDPLFTLPVVQFDWHPAQEPYDI